MYIQFIQNSESSSNRALGRPQQSHWHNEVCHYLNEEIPHRWIGQYAVDDLVLFSWTPRYPDLTVSDFFFFEDTLKIKVYVPPMPAILDKLRERITAALNGIDRDTLQRVRGPWITM